jgi:Putative inner membrane protein (DUF1819)
MNGRQDGTTISQVSIYIQFTVTNMLYTAHTKNAFPLVEAANVAALLSQGVSAEKIRSQVLDDDLFQLRSRVSRLGMLRSVLNCLDGLSDTYLDFLARGDLELRKLTLLFLILRHNRLLRDFVHEFLLDKLSRMDPVLHRNEINAFFGAKREQTPTLSAWSDSTFQKAVSNSILALVKSGVLYPLEQKDKYEIRAFPVPTPLRQQLLNDGFSEYLKLLLN